MCSRSYPHMEQRGLNPAPATSAATHASKTAEGLQPKTRFAFDAILSFSARTTALSLPSSSDAV